MYNLDKQLCEMVGKDGPEKSTAGSTTPSDTSLPRKTSSITDWVSLRPRILSEEEKQHWVPDEAATKCSNCDADFSAFVRRVRLYLFPIIINAE